MRALSPTNGLTALLLLLATTPINAKWGLDGCTSYETTAYATRGGYSYRSMLYYIPDTLEICTYRDCGGGRAPVKTDVPGCAAYKGTGTPAPDFLESDPAAVPKTTSVTSTTMETIVITRDPTATATATPDTSSEPVSEDESKTETGSVDPTSASSVAAEPTGNGTVVPGPSQTQVTGSAAGKFGVGLSLIVAAALGAAIVV